MRALALGGAVVAGELWIPGRVLISLPSPRPFPTEDELDRAVARFLLHDSEIIRYKELWIAASQNGGALLSKDGIHWEAIHPTELYRNGDRVVSVRHEWLEEASA
jgi:hypothetical protein